MTVIIDCPSCDANIRPPMPALCPDCGTALMAPKELLPPPPKSVQCCRKCGSTEHEILYLQEADEPCQSYNCPGPYYEHLHAICCCCRYKSWKHRADHVEAPALPIACKACGATKPLYSIVRRLCHECHMNQFPNDTTQLPCKHSNAVSRQGTIIDDKIWSYIKTCEDCGYEWEVLPENLPVRERGRGGF